LAFVIGLGLGTLIVETEIIFGFCPDFEGGRGLDLDKILVKVSFNIIS
jgi:hypothetical protein